MPWSNAVPNVERDTQLATQLADAKAALELQKKDTQLADAKAALENQKIIAAQKLKIEMEKAKNTTNVRLLQSHTSVLDPRCLGPSTALVSKTHNFISRYLSDNLFTEMCRCARR
jgi:hypothetical protein